jgi:hypothetical protein
MPAAANIDPITQAHNDAKQAVATFLPSLVGRQDPPPAPPPPSPLAVAQQPQDAIRALALAGHVERQAYRVARNLPPQREQAPTPEEQFGNNLDIVHTRALANAISSVPETERGKLISEAHDSAVKWIAAHNGKVIVHGKVKIAGSKESAENLAAQIVNDTVEDHDQRKQAEAANVQPAPGSTDSAGNADQGSATPVPAQGTSPAASGGPDTGTGPTSDSAPVGSGNGIIPQSPTIVPPGGDGEITDPGPPPAVSPDEAAQVGEENDAGEQITQPKNSLEENQALAMDAAPELHQALTQMTSAIPGLKFDKLRPQKDISRAKDKLDDANDPNTLSDYLGAQIAADSPQAKDQIIDALQSKFKTIEVDDHFLTGKPNKAHYPSANVQVQLSNGSTAEVQIVPREVQETNDQSHVFYKAGREAEEKGDEAERDRQWEQAAQIHDAQLAKFKARNGIGVNAAPAGQSLLGMNPIGKPIQIGRHTFVRVQPQQQPDQNTVAPSQPSQELPPDSSPQTQPVSPDQPPVQELSPSPDSTPNGQPLAKGAKVTLKDGRQAEVMYVHPNIPLARVRVDGKVEQINTDKDIADGAAQG